MPMDVSSSRPSNKANIFLGLIEYELNSLLGASHLVDYISVHIRFDLERYLLNVFGMKLYIFVSDTQLIKRHRSNIKLKSKRAEE